MTLLKTLIKATVYWSYPVKLGTSPPVNSGSSGGCVVVLVVVVVVVGAAARVPLRVESDTEIIMFCEAAG